MKEDRFVERVVATQKLEQLVSDILRQVGVPEDEASLTADALISADARGMNSHGIMRLPIYVKRIRAGGIKPGKKGQILRETSSTILLDGENGIGQVIAMRAMQEAIKKAKKVGVAAVGVTRSNHCGEAAHYVLKAVKQDMIGILTTNGSPNMPAWGGVTKLVGTLPLAVGIPSKEELPIVLDISLGTVSKGKVLYASKKGEEISLGWGVDFEGKPTRDPQKVINGGWIPPIGAYKGWGLILIADILSGVLTGGRIGREITDLYSEPSSPQGLGHFLMAINVEAFGPVEDFRRRIDSMIRTIKDSKLAPGFKTIMLPGERELKMERLRRKEGVPLSVDVLKEIEVLAKKCGVKGQI